ncbi:MAG: transposase family protein [Oscillatoria sp. SIO1A7]|nr:transposase family protein [Oscillatoria sp. SIO1A7]
MNLISHLKQVRDFRTQPRYPLWVVLLLVIMGTMSNCLGYRALGDFVVRHQKVLLELMKLPHKRLPCYSTIRRVMIRIDYTCLSQVFNDWAQAELIVAPKEQVAVDGKSIKASLQRFR